MPSLSVLAQSQGPPLTGQNQQLSAVELIVYLTWAIDREEAHCT